MDPRGAISSRKCARRTKNRGNRGCVGEGRRARQGMGLIAALAPGIGAISAIVGITLHLHAQGGVRPKVY